MAWRGYYTSLTLVTIVIVTSPMAILILGI